jgi:hypothetical protein
MTFVSGPFSREFAISQRKRSAERVVNLRSSFEAQMEPYDLYPVIFYKGWKVEVFEDDGVFRVTCWQRKGEKHTRTFKNMLAVADSEVAPEEFHLYAIRFVQSVNGPRPVLYREGKRVTQAWRIELSAEVPEDQLGKNANTT